ncbi:SPOR domain-containing protein [Albibacterium bauzanense]|uniref:Sporulation related protein n=1 Tax=Albibacterium bauzanense TaxID=653929 RepID=A0A4V2PYH8_9SPHI|nr:SPOR domain-containing protein [Albibacterium bauzanense]TCK85751.1 sporulation related protein [Albibacterium bauzanense]
MNTLGLYIKEALQDKREIYLPGIGTFKKERIPAFFNDLKQCFMPPFQSIVLTDKQPVSDQSLIQFIAEKENIDLEESRLKIEQTISELETELQEKEEIILEGFGKLKRIETRYEFTHFQPVLEGAFNDYEPVAEAEIILPIEKKAGITNPSIDLNTDEALLPVEESTINEEYLEQESNSKKWLWPVLALVICVVAAAFWFLNPNFNFANLTNTAESGSNKQVIEQPVTEAPATAATQSTDLSTQAPLSESTEQVTPDPVNNNPSASLVKEAQGRFEVIIAAFNTMEEAEAYVNRTNAKGYNVYIIKNNNPGNLNKISYGPFQTAEEADQALIKVREELTKEAWVFENKSKK